MILKQTKKLTLAAMFFAIGLILPFVYCTNPNDWTDAVTYAYSGIAVRIDCRMGIWPCSRFFSSTCQKHLFWNAGYVSECRFHGL